ncbi:MAG: dicarboxylate/amino acid:cation symporter [Psychroflexus halocasei]|uniref:dicarboxylate/amino acid:cation symporter n=1 Tax=Psychroflexus sp. S27 TaxID=1982757 RepID=UPI000C2A02AF|nr:dicarboxylate/amino acid:cation symporter [Psychroflexus sp. S27]PJX22876.1 sodium:proton antiporter [Psychroflexus sp. S27]
MLKKITHNLLFKVFVAIILGILIGLYTPESVNRIVNTFNAFFGEFLGFAIPLIILGLIMPAIADLGKGAGKLLLITAALAYGSTLFSGFSTYFVASSIFPSFIEAQNVQAIEETARELTPYFSLTIPPVLDVMSALVLAFVIGLGLAPLGNSALKKVTSNFQKIIMFLIEKVIIPLLPLYILSIFSAIAFKGQVASVLSVFVKIIGVIFIMHILLMVIQYIIAGAITKKNPFKALITMAPAYFTALGTQSSAATIPVTLQQAEKNGVSPKVANFVIPLGATIHLAGSTMKIVACAVALMLMQGMDFNFGMFAGFVMMLGIAMVAAPGVPGGAIMAAVGILQTMLGFDAEAQALMIALYIAMDSFGTAANITGDGAIALIVNRIVRDKKETSTS